MSPVLIHSPRIVSFERWCYRPYREQIESPLTSSVPGCPWDTAFPDSSTILASYPSTTVPLQSGRTSSSRLEMKMWQHSVEPMPSRTSTPVLSFQRRRIEPGRGSPAETQARTELTCADCQVESGAASAFA